MVGYWPAAGTGTVWRCPDCANSASRVTASVQDSGATEAGWPAEFTCSGSEPSFVRCAASQPSRAAAWLCCPAAASNSAKNAVSAVQATPGVPGQFAPGFSPPLGRVSTRWADLAARSTAGPGAANGGPRNVTAASAPDLGDGVRW